MQHPIDDHHENNRLDEPRLEKRKRSISAVHGGGETIEITVAPTELEASLRADQYISGLPSFPPRSQLKQRMTALTVNGNPAKLSARVRAGDTIALTLLPELTPEVSAESIDLDVLFEDDNVLVINKAAGMVVHPGAGNWTGTLLHALMGRYAQDTYFSAVASDTSRFDGSDQQAPERHTPVRPGIVHRLDKDTSGVMIVAKNAVIHHFLTAQFAARSTGKTYIALVKGSPIHTTGYVTGSLERDPRHRTRFRVTGKLQHATIATLDSEIPGWTESSARNEGGKPALTTYTVLRRFTGYSLVMLRPHTGRTHQLRVHLAAIGSPIVGDPVYARADGGLREPPLMLHAFRLAIVARPGGAVQRFTAPVPESFRQIVRQVRVGSTKRR